jgi:hypothetical protein
VKTPLDFLLCDSGAPEHLADFRKSGLSDDTIRLHGFRSVPPSFIGRLLAGGRPTALPRPLARWTRDWTRSPIRARSNWAMAAMTWKMRLLELSPAASTFPQLSPIG